LEAEILTEYSGRFLMLSSDSTIYFVLQANLIVAVFHFFDDEKALSPKERSATGTQ
jgi:hypothetical protein